MGLIRNAFAIIKEHKKAFLAIHVAYYSVFVISMIVTAIFPHLQESAIQAVNEQLDQPGLGTAVSDAYESGNVLWAAVVTLVVNVILGAFLTTTAPSLIIPFFGIAFMIYRVSQWGILFAPIGPEAGAFIPHSITLVIEGEAYVIAAFAAWLHGRMFLQPHQFELPSRWAGYKAGLMATLRLYPLVLVALIIGAIYEAIEVICFVPFFL